MPTIERARPGDEAEILQLLRNSFLPIEGVLDHLSTAVVARADGRIVGSAALEVYPEGALLRSVAVDLSVRGRGVGQQLTLAALELAAAHGSPAVYLLTTAAEQFFPKFDFTPISRAQVPDSVQQSIEFLSACPATATVMRKELRRLQVRG